MKGRGVEGCMSSSSSSSFSDPSLVKKSPQVFRRHLHVRDRDREYDFKFFYLILFSSKFTSFYWSNLKMLHCATVLVCRVVQSLHINRMQGYH